MTAISTKSNKITTVLLIAILLGGFLARLYRFNGPVADWHSWRQADTSAVSRNFVAHGFDVLHPKFEDLSNVPSGLDNPQGYRFVEFPIYNVAQAGLYDLFHILTLEEWGRIVSIISSLFASLFLFLLLKSRASTRIALFAAFFNTFIPFNIYYSRTILPDPSMIMAVLGSIYFFNKFLLIKQKKSDKVLPYVWYLLAILFSITSLLLKPYAIFFILPIVVLVYYEYKLKMFWNWQLWVYGIVSVIPLLLWRHYIASYPEGIPANAWLLNGNGIRFRPSFFRWMLYERLTRLISGYIGIALFGLGVFIGKKQKNKLFLYSFLVSSIIYICVFATGNVQHDYYQILIIPSIAIFYGIGANYLYELPWKKSSLPVFKILLLLITILMLYFGWAIVKDYFNINNPSIIVAGKAVDELTPKNAKVIANYNGDTSFLYQTNRNGWASYERDLPGMIKLGADYLVIANPLPSDFSFARAYRIVKRTNQYVIFNLRASP